MKEYEKCLRQILKDEIEDIENMNAEEIEEAFAKSEIIDRYPLVVVVMLYYYDVEIDEEEFKELVEFTKEFYNS